MRLHSVRNSCRCLLAALLLSPSQGFAAEPAERSRTSMRVAQAIFGAFEYSRKVAEYNAARQQYEAEKKKGRPRGPSRVNKELKQVTT